MSEEKQIYICENCGKEHDGSYGSGRFCSDHCRRCFYGKFNKGVQIGHPDYNYHNKSKEYSWVCSCCSQVFRTRRELQEHRKGHTLEELKNNKGDYHCQYCGRPSPSKNGNTLHEKYCQLNPNKIEYPSHPQTQEVKQYLSDLAKKTKTRGKSYF